MKIALITLGALAIMVVTAKAIAELIFAVETVIKLRAVAINEAEIKAVLKAFNR